MIACCAEGRDRSGSPRLGHLAAEKGGAVGRQGEVKTLEQTKLGRKTAPFRPWVKLAVGGHAAGSVWGCAVETCKRNEERSCRFGTHQRGVGTRGSVSGG